ncbi:MAG: VWA domain-containing protein [Gemmatimonadetes bacterium]|nr:VWA domain-containing protein [Gemmatimonadota bacterium]NNM05073.1 VWA domain-containing protein [Gemmatimonadota bacterium]
MFRKLKENRASPPLGNQRGGVLLLVAVGLVTWLAMAGLAIDVGRGYIVKAHLSRAVDAAALAAARSLRRGESEARQNGLAVARANGVEQDRSGTTISLGFSSNEWDEETVSVAASRNLPTVLMKLIGHDRVEVRAGAVAVIPPVDMVLVLDQSGSLGSAGAWDDLQKAARAFVRHFDDKIDQVGMVSFNARAENHFNLSQPFTGKAISTISSMHSVSYTNTGEGLRLAFEQFNTGPNVRDRSAKVVVFFTDGRPTAFSGPVGGQDRILTAWSGSAVNGYWDIPDPVSIDPAVSPGAKSCGSSGCWGYDKNRVWGQAEQDGLFWADQIRRKNILVYTIGLGDPTRPPGDPLLARPQYLRELANEGHISDPNQPEGKMYFAPGPDELLKVFNLVAQDLLARLAQ